MNRDDLHDDSRHADPDLASCGSRARGGAGAHTALTASIVPILRKVMPVTIAVGVVLLAGCERPSKVQTTQTEQDVRDPWPIATAQLRKNTHPGSIRRTLDQLNVALAAHADAAIRPAGLSPEAEAKLATIVTLSDAERREIQATSFTPLDSHYLAECLYLQDVARTLELKGLPAAKQAEQAFAWVCRQVVLRPWRMYEQIPTGMKPAIQLMPPAYVLRRGSGCELERMIVFLALAQQLRLDVCLVGEANANQRLALPAVDANGKIAASPFWAVGVRVDDDILLFDVRREQAFPDTLRKIAANPALMKPWREDAANPWPITDEQLRSATLYISTSLSALAPRFERLQQTMPNEGNLYVDAAALRNRFVTEAKQPTTQFWKSVQEPFFSMPHLLGSILPVSDGGSELSIPLSLATVPPNRVKDAALEYKARILPAYNQSLYPVTVLDMSPELDPFHPANASISRYLAVLAERNALPIYKAAFEPQANLQGASRDEDRSGSASDPNSIAAFIARESAPEQAKQKQTFAFLTKASTRSADESQMTVLEQIQRGRFFEVAPELVEKRDEFQHAADRVRSDNTREKSLHAWIADLRKVFPELLNAQQRADTDPARFAEVQRDFMQTEQKHAVARFAAVESEVGEPGIAETTYLLALCRHEQAEREQARFERLQANPKLVAQAAKAGEKARLAWSEAVGWWQRYEPFAAVQERSFPGRTRHAASLAERATRLAGQ